MHIWAEYACSYCLAMATVLLFDTTGPLSAVGNVSGNRCESDCRSRGR